LETLSRRRKLLDVVFVDDDRTVTYSVRNGMGIRPDGEDVEFPEGTQLHANSLKEALNGKTTHTGCCTPTFGKNP
jgi:hypothetical protein